MHNSCFDYLKHSTSGWAMFVKHKSFYDMYNNLHFHEILHHSKTVAPKFQIRQKLLT